MRRQPQPLLGLSHVLTVVPDELVPSECQCQIEDLVLHHSEWPYHLAHNESGEDVSVLVFVGLEDGANYVDEEERSFDSGAVVLKMM